MVVGNLAALVAGIQIGENIQTKRLVWGVGADWISRVPSIRAHIAR
jgi:hypothetical protein